ncbi:4a-hydroxytetrahydrobiopterin dehydratase [Acidihalobacter prosperus]
MDSFWRMRTQPACMERQYTFPSYGLLRDFLDRAADLSERRGYYPDMGFGRTYVNVTIRPGDGQEEIQQEQRTFAEALDGLFSEIGGEPAETGGERPQLIIQ